jgi:hypothetical protein
MTEDRFEQIMRQLDVKPLSNEERVRFTEKLDNRINRYQRRAVSFYRMSYGMGTAMLALIAISVISIWSSVHQIDNNGQDYMTDLNALSNYYGYSEATSDTLNERYVDLLVSDYVSEYGTASSDYLLGDLSDEEIQYIQNNLDVGDIL